MDPNSPKKEWGSENWTRASGECVCDICGKTYYKHPTESGPGYGFCSDDVLNLKRLCDGRLVKL